MLCKWLDVQAHVVLPATCSPLPDGCVGGLYLVNAVAELGSHTHFAPC